MSFVRTALADVAPALLGPTNYHEHLFQISPLLPGDELDDEKASGDELVALGASGRIAAIVDATPVGLGRDPAGCARISARVGMHVVLTTGMHRSAHYAPAHWLLACSVETLTDLFVHELTIGVGERDVPDAGAATGPGGQPVRAGMLKCGIGYWSIDEVAARAIAAVGAAHRATGAPVMVHLEHGSAMHEVLDLLEKAGVAADRVVLAHADRNPDAHLHREVAARGAYLGYDGMARHREWPDSALVRLVEDVCARHGDRVLLGGDVARRSRYRAYGGIPGMAYLPDRFLPRLTAEVGEETVHRLLIDNPAQLLTWSAPAGDPAHDDQPQQRQEGS